MTNKQLFKNIQEELITAINVSKSSLKIAVTWFTNHDIFNSIITKLNNPNFQVELIVLNDSINNKKEGLDFQKLIDYNGNFYYSNVENMVHHKFCIIDDEIVLTGSYNWTYYAENRNWENIIITSEHDAVSAYIEEFEQIKLHHKKVKNIESEKTLSVNTNSESYLFTDYKIQAEIESRRGNNLIAAKLYTECLKLDNAHIKVKEIRNTILNTINAERLNYCPFEIGIKYKNGYATAIPAFTPLPVTKIMIGATPSNGLTSLKVTIQKFDYHHQTIDEFQFNNLKPAVAGTKKIEHILNINEFGVLTIICKELNGYNRTLSPRAIDLKKYF